MISIRTLPRSFVNQRQLCLVCSYFWQEIYPIWQVWQSIVECMILHGSAQANGEGLVLRSR